MLKPVRRPHAAEIVRDIEARFVAANPKSLAQFKQAGRSLPGGNTRIALHYDPFSVAIERAQGGWLYDHDGHAYRDFMNDLTAGLYGHSHPAIIGALKGALDHLFGIDVNAALGAVEELDLPIVLPISISIDDLLAPIGGNGSHIEGGQLGLEAHSRGYALINRRRGAATRGDVDDGIGRAPDLADELAINLRVKGGPARLRVARMQVENRRAGLRGRNGLIGNFVRGNRQIGRHGRGMHAPCDGARQNDLLVLCHPQLRGRTASVSWAELLAVARGDRH